MPNIDIKYIFKKQLRPDNLLMKVDDFVNLKPSITFKNEVGNKLHIVSIRNSEFGLVKENEDGTFKFMAHWPKEIVYNIS